jgi:hypothetical protein
LSPARRRRERTNLELRRRGLAHLDAFSRGESREPQFRKVLVDGQWDNANFWIRYALIRRALGLAKAREVGILGRHNRARVVDAFATLGFAAQVDFGRHLADADEFLQRARTLLSDMRDAGDIHRCSLPASFPGALLYDGILKRQRRADVDMCDPKLPHIVAEALSALHLAEEILARERPDLVVMSHTVDFTYGALAWMALSAGIPVIAAYGDYGTNRFIRLSRPEDIFAYPSRPSPEQGRLLTPQRRAALSEVGRRILEARLGGNTADVSTIYAYRRRKAFVDRKLLAERYGWDTEKPIVGVYAPNWFDYPNGSGRLPFRDFRDWVDVTLAVARQTPQVNWLFKAHPCDEWYGRIRGARLVEILSAQPAPNVQLCDTDWNGRALLETFDALVTVHGTAGLEMASMGKAVLIPYEGWYGGFGCAVVAQSMDDYRAKLATRWWDSFDAASAADRARYFAGWYFAAPAWHDGWCLSDDSQQDAIWWDLDQVFAAYEHPIRREVAEIADWIASGNRYFQIFKLLRAEAFMLASARAIPHGIADKDPRQRQLSDILPA